MNAQSQGAPDIFMNILSTNAYCSRYITDWAPPDAFVKLLSLRLGVPVLPTLTFTGSVTAVSHEGGETIVEVELRATNHLGDHASGTTLVSLPA